MSPDSSINASMLITQTTGQLFGASANKMASPNVVRVQVQECSQSQQPSVAPNAAPSAAPYSHLAGHLRQPPTMVHRHHPYHHHNSTASSTVPTSSCAATGPLFFVNKTLANRGPIVVPSSLSSAMLPPGHDYQATASAATAVNPIAPMTSTTLIKQEPTQHHQHQPQQHQSHQQPQPHRPETPEYTKSFPVMDTTVASSVKGEPDLNIGMSAPQRVYVVDAIKRYAHTNKSGNTHGKRMRQYTIM